jgi:regulator of sigma E protease
MDVILNFIQNTGHLVLYYIIPVLVVLGIMIFFHELGHFLAAKYFGVKVLKFALGFGPKIATREVGETEYSIRYFPLGGFVKMLGEDENDEESVNIPPDEELRAFNHQHALKRIAIVAAGPVFNLILAVILFFGLYLVAGDQILTAEIGEVIEGSPAQKAGLKEGDLIVSTQDIEIKKWEDLREIIKDKAGIKISMVIRRGDKLIPVSVIPEESVAQNEFGEDVKTSRIGIVTAGKFEKIEIGPIEALKLSFTDTWKWIKLTCLVIVKLFQGVVSIKNVGGPIMIGQMTGQITQENVAYLVPFMAVISINLGILNLFPIPILDGGVIFFLLIELIIGRPLSTKKRELAQKIGLSLLIALTLIVFYNDILRLFQ